MSVLQTRSPNSCCGRAVNRLETVSADVDQTMLNLTLTFDKALTFSTLKDRVELSGSG